MLRAYLKLLSQRLATQFDAATSRIDHQHIIKELTSHTELSGSYLLMLASSCLVALLGLLTNSVAVVIGAMLISPLMGPIFTVGLAFTLGDLRLARKVLRIIVISILLSILIAACFTILSPLKAPTAEILSRTRPNLYDLLIAGIAGAAGAYALCAKKNYLFVTTGVAVATAVIPPLSVVGYGVGTGQFTLAVGGFLLFFTNLVAIVISSDLVFHLFRFRATMVEGAEYPIRRRYLILGIVLALVSIPLVITLVTDLRKARLGKRIEQVLKRHLDSRDHSRMTTYLFQKGPEGLAVSASVNTVSYLEASKTKQIENDLASELKTPVQLDLEEIIVRSGRVDMPVQSRLMVPAPPPAPEKLAALRAKAIRRLDEGCLDLLPYFAPFPMRGVEVTFSNQYENITVRIVLGRDYPATEQEMHWARVALSKNLGEPVVVDITTVPFLPPLALGQDGVPTEASWKALSVLAQINKDWPGKRFVIVAPQKHGAEAIRRYLESELGLPSSSIVERRERSSEARVMVLSE